MKIERLYGYWRSSSSWRVRTMLYFKELTDWEYVGIHLVEEGGRQHSEEHRERNPMRQVPVLEVTDEGATHHVSQSIAILELLEEQFPEPALLPADPIERARARQLAELVNSGIQPLQNLAIIQHLRDDLDQDAAAFCSRWIARGLEAYEAIVAEHQGSFSVGDAPSFADICLIPQLYNARRFDLELSPYPRLLTIEETCMSLEPFQLAHPDEQPDAQSVS
jgi:maleylpyruvate isomerase